MIRRLANPPANWNGRRPAAPPGAVDVNVVGDQLAAYWNDGDGQAMTAGQWQTYVTGASYSRPADEVDRETKAANVDNAIATLRQWSLDAKAVAAQGANVTQAQHKALFDRMGTFLDRFADYVEARR